MRYLEALGAPAVAGWIERVSWHLQDAGGRGIVVTCENIRSNVALPTELRGRMTRTEKQKMLAGELYRPSDPELHAERAANKIWMAEYNSAMVMPADNRRALLQRRLGYVGEGRLSNRRSFATTGTTSGSGKACF